MQDLIYRQEAIDAMHQYSYFNDFDVSVIDEDLAVIALKDLPSAYPEPHWISCSEILPENGYWLWSAKGGEVQKDFYWDGHWEHAEKYGYEVVAWMPLPEPPKEDDNDHI